MYVYAKLSILLLFSHSRGDPTAAAEVLSGQDAERAGPYGSADSHGTLEVSGVPQEDPQRVDDKCWFCEGASKMTCSHILLHRPNEKLRAARVEAWEGKDPGGVRVLLANLRWEQRFVKFLELSGVGRVMADGTVEMTLVPRRWTSG